MAVHEVNRTNADDAGIADGRRSWRTTLVSVCLLATAAASLLLIYSTEPTAVKETATRRTAALVSVKTVARGRHRPMIEGLGRVEAAQDVAMSARVGGLVVAMSDNVEPGGFVAKGETLFTLDPADYEVVVRQRRSDLRRARSELELELGRRDVARGARAASRRKERCSFRN